MGNDGADRTLKYLILRKRRLENPFLDLIAAGTGDGFELPFNVEIEEMAESDVADQRRDSTVDDLIPSIPFSLIAPVEESTPEVHRQSAWGIDAVGATKCSQNGSGVTVAILDTGIDIAHPAFAGVTFDPADLMDFTIEEQGTPGEASDSHGHGTHVAATIFGRDVEGTRIGVARGINKVLIGKVLGPGGGGTETVFSAIEWALKRRADVISMSLGMDFQALVKSFINGGFPEDIAASRALKVYRSNIRLFDRLSALVEARGARGRGALLVAAAGNESRRQLDPRFTVAVAPPAAADGFISVGAVGPTNTAEPNFTVARFSNTGCLLAAPGVSILSAKLGGGLIVQSGTSMATPHVAGVIALWTQKLFPDSDRPNGWAKDVQRALEAHVLPAQRQTRNDIGLGIVRAPE